MNPFRAFFQNDKNTYRLHQKLSFISYQLSLLIQQGEELMPLIDDIVVKVHAQTTVVASVEALLIQLKTMLENAGTDPAKLQEVMDTLDVNTTRLADAVIANTPTP